MRLERFPIGTIETNCYLIYNEETKELLIVDPADAPALVFEHIENNGLKPIGILLTHGHFDHITGVTKWQEKYPDIVIYAGENEREMLENPDLNMTHRWGSEGISLLDVTYLKDGEVINLIGEEIKVIWTPGHTYGGVEFYFENEKVLISGDSLFKGTVGRTDLPTGSNTALKTSLMEKICILPDDVRVFPGHGEATTIKEEKEINPFLR